MLLIAGDVFGESATEELVGVLEAFAEDELGDVGEFGKTLGGDKFTERVALAFSNKVVGLEKFEDKNGGFVQGEVFNVFTRYVGAMRELDAASGRRVATLFGEAGDEDGLDKDGIDAFGEAERGEKAVAEENVLGGGHRAIVAANLAWCDKIWTWLNNLKRALIRADRQSWVR